MRCPIGLFLLCHVLWGCDLKLPERDTSTKGQETPQSLASTTQATTLAEKSVKTPLLEETRFTGPKITPGSKVKVLEISPGDSYFSEKEKILAQTCTVKAPLQNNGENFFSGRVECGENNKSYYFFKVAVHLLSAMAPEETIEPIAGNPSTLAVLPPGSVFKILEIGEGDSYLTEADTLIGLVCNVAKDGMDITAEQFYGGDAICGPDEKSFYFYKVKVELVSKGTPTGAPTSMLSGMRYTGSKIKAGTVVKILAVHPDDAYFDQAGTLVGQTCTTKELHNNSNHHAEGFFGGEVECGAKKDYYYFYKAAFEIQ